VKTMAGMLLEYVMNNFKVDDGGDVAILQTLVVSLVSLIPAGPSPQ
jgi:hypothetical protein